VRTTCSRLRPKAFVTTTDSNHALEIYLNLAWRVTLTGIDQLWVADITYIPVRAEFVYLAVFSRKVVGWKLDSTLTSRLATEAIEQAIAARRPKPWPGAPFRSRPPVRVAPARPT
jgi:transposase InsO family protein